jgi:uncharacterized membrane protein YoaK (UPF0700 family)
MKSLPMDRIIAALLLAMIAGCVDAVGFSELGGYFVSFMSGNSTRLGLHLGYHEWPSALFVGGLVALFVGGAAVGTLVVDRAGRGAAAGVLLVEAALLVAAAFLIDGPRPMIGIILLPVAMGLSNAFVPGERGARIGLTYMTGTLVRIGSGLARLGTPGEGKALLLDIALWLALVLGVALGGQGRLHYGGVVLLAPVVLLIALALIELWFSRRRTI